MAKLPEIKSWFTSRTVWFNVISFTVAVAVQLQGQNLPKEVMDVLAMIVTVGNIILRFDTSKAIK